MKHKIGDIVMLTMPNEFNGQDRHSYIPKHAWLRYVGMKLVIDCFHDLRPRLMNPTTGDKIVNADNYQWWWPPEFVVPYKPRIIRRVAAWK